MAESEIKWIELLKSIGRDKSFYNKSEKCWMEIRFNRSYSEYTEIKRDANELILFSTVGNFFLKISESLYFGFDLAKSWSMEDCKHYGRESNDLIRNLNGLDFEFFYFGC